MMIENILLTSQCCQNCKAPSNQEFFPVVSLKKSGLNFKKLKNSYENKGGIIVCNAGSKTLQRFDYIAELCQYKTKCFNCKILIQYIRDLIDNISTLKVNDIIGICEHCKRVKEKIKCHKCEYTVDKFLKSQVQNYMDRENKYQEQLDNLNKMLLSILQCGLVCKHNIYHDTEPIMQLESIDKLNVPTSRKIDIDDFPEKYHQGDIRVNEEQSQILPKAIAKLSIGSRNSDLLRRESSESERMCICKHLLNLKAKLSVEELIYENERYLLKMSPENTNKTQYDVTSKEVKRTLSSGSQNMPESSSKMIMDVKKLDKNIQKLKGKNVDGKRAPKKDKSLKGTSKQTGQSEVGIMLKLMKEREKNREKRKITAHHENISKANIYSKVEDLPVKKTIINTEAIHIDESESFIECKATRHAYAGKMIKGCDVVYYDCHYKTQKTLKPPLLFQVQANFTAPSLPEESCSIHSNVEGRLAESKQEKYRSKVNSGTIFYQLSNPEYIDKGWTKLPAIKIMRRMNVYKMIPCSKFSWFDRHKGRTLFYDSGEKLAEVYENGGGMWFYKNGKVALEYCNIGEVKRYIIFSCHDELKMAEKKAVNILACFDHLGHGILYDYNGNIRLKYNQSEGITVDERIGPAGRWKWHTLNDPPVLHPVFINTFEKSSSILPKYVNNSSEMLNKADDDMVPIELKKLLSQKTVQLQKIFKPFQVRIKAIKINNYFSLRIIEQSKIYIQFRCGRISQRINVGMLLKSDEIIGTETAEVTEVATPYDLRSGIIFGKETSK